jgi:hypothetical protein
MRELNMLHVMKGGERNLALLNWMIFFRFFYEPSFEGIAYHFDFGDVTNSIDKKIRERFAR